MFVTRSFAGSARSVAAPVVATSILLAVLAAFAGCRGAGEAFRSADGTASAPPNAASTDAPVSASTGAPSAGALRGADDSPIDAGAATIVVSGLACPKCASNVDQELTRIPGVKVRNVDMKHGLVSVAFDGAARPSSAQLARAVADAGLTWRGWSPVTSTEARP